MANQQPPTLRPWSQRPFIDQENATLNQFHDWIITSVNALIGQNVPAKPGFGSLQQPIISPGSGQLASQGSRAASLSTPVIAIPQSTIITFYWDGTNGSTPLTIYRDDNTIIGSIVGKLVVTGLTPNTTYYFFPFFQDIATGSETITNVTGEVAGSVNFAGVGAAKPVGTPPVAYTTQQPLAVQRQWLLDHIPLWANLGTVGVTTTVAGTGAPVNGGSGGGGGTGKNGGFQLP